MTALCAYRLGVDALVGGRPAAAMTFLSRALAADPELVLAWAALAATLHELDEPEEAAAALARARAPRRQSRRDSHHIAVVALAIGGPLPRATALGREHLEEFGDDRLVRHVLARWADDGE